SRAPAGGGDLLCILDFDEEIQLWSMSADRHLATVSLKSAAGAPEPAVEMPVNSQLAATRHGCLVLAAGHALLLDGAATLGAVETGGRHADADADADADPGQASAGSRQLASKASAIAYQAGRILVAGDEQALIFDENGTGMASVAVARGVSALGLVDGGRLLVVGYDAGDLDLQPIDPATAKPTFSFEETIPAVVERIVEGPRRTLVVGYTSGHLGIWSLETGKRLRHYKLHGPVVHLLVDDENRHLYAATELGDYRAIDLTALYQDYCELLRDIWNNVPVVWQEGMPALEATPASHRCLGFRAEEYRTSPHRGW
ncbi:MAG: hypothetical protein V2A73_13130, partial [Pseudomonadota bacterium]